jgi:hypothetical protein
MLKTIVLALFLSSIVYTTLVLVRYETDIYSVDFFEGLVHSFDPDRLGPNYVWERNGYRFVRNARYEGKKDGGIDLPKNQRKHDFENFVVYVFIPVDENSRGGLVSRPLRKQDLPVSEDNYHKNIAHQQKRIGNLDVIQSTCRSEGLDPLGKLWIYYTRSYFELSNN